MTTPASTMTYTVSATTRTGGTASVHARTSDTAFDGSAQSGALRRAVGVILKNVEPFAHAPVPLRVGLDMRLHYRRRVVTDEPAVRVELLHKNIRKFGTLTNTPRRRAS